MANLIDPIIETIIFLKEDVCYIEQGKFYRVTCPDGFSGDLKRTLSANCIDMQLWQHLGAKVEEIPTPKIRSLPVIPGIKFYRKDEKAIAYASIGKPQCSRN